MPDLLKNLLQGDRFYHLSDPYNMTWTVESPANNHIVLCRDTFDNLEEFNEDDLVWVIRRDV